MANDERLPWFPCEPGPLLGALAGMRPHVGYTYWIVCLRIYEIGGPCQDTLDALARRTGYTKRIVSDALDQLFRAGKLLRDGAGIMNPKAEAVLAEMANRQAGLSQGGKKGARQRWGKSQSNQQTDDSLAMGRPMASDAHLHLQGQLQLGSKEEVPPPEAGVGDGDTRKSLPALDWRPDDRGMLFARTLGFPDAKIEQMIQACVYWHRKNGKKVAGAIGRDAMWRNWCNVELGLQNKRAAQNVANQGGSGRGGRPTFGDVARGLDVGGFNGH